MIKLKKDVKREKREGKIRGRWRERESGGDERQIVKEMIEKKDKKNSIASVASH